MFRVSCNGRSGDQSGGGREGDGEDREGSGEMRVEMKERKIGGRGEEWMTTHLQLSNVI